MKICEILLERFLLCFPICFVFNYVIVEKYFRFRSFEIEEEEETFGEISSFAIAIEQMYGRIGQS